MFVGELAALGTAIMFSFGSTMFTISGRMIGSQLLNRMRLLLSLLLVMLMHLATTGELIPLGAESEHWFWLGISGFIGFVLGDALLFQGFVLVGPRLSMLMMALAPVLATLLGWIFLDEILSVVELLGIALTIAGIAWVILERGSTRDTISPRAYVIGLLFGLGGATGQATGLITAKLGLYGDFLPLSALVIRLMIAVLAIWTVAAFQFRIISGFRTLRSQSRALMLMLGGSLSGPVIGVWLSLVAVQLAPVGIASTLMSLTPIFLIPISYFIFGEKPTPQMIFGTLLAFVGTALLFV